MTRRKGSKAKRLQPADVLQENMEFYSKLIKEEQDKGAECSMALVKEYRKLMQDAAKELGPYRHGRALAGDGDDTKKNYVLRIGGLPEFDSVEEWEFYYAVVEAKRDHDGSNLNEKMRAILERFNPPENVKPS